MRKPAGKEVIIKSEISGENLDHLGIVAGLIDEIGIVEILNKRLGIDPREKVSTGVIVKAMLLNGLGFVSAPLYLFGQFFQGKATEQLLGVGIKPEHLNDDRLGNVLDEVHTAIICSVTQIPNYFYSSLTSGMWVVGVLAIGFGNTGSRLRFS